METYTIRVGWTSQRPIIPDQHWSWVMVATDEGPAIAKQIAAQMASTHSVMPTSTTILEVEL